MSDIRPPVAPFLGVFGVAAMVTPFGGRPVATTAIRHDRPSASELLADPTVLEKRWFSLPVVDVGSLPRASTMVIADGPDAGTWMIERVDSIDGEFWRVVVH